MIVVSGNDIAQVVRTGKALGLRFAVRDRDVFNALPGVVGAEHAIGEICWGPEESVKRSLLSALGEPIVTVNVAAEDGSIHRSRARVQVAGKMYAVTGATLTAGGWAIQEVQVVPVKEDLFSRSRGLIETGVLAGKRVFLKGIGSLGSTVFRLLVQSGVGKFVLMDPDRVEISNVVRHEAGISDVGRFKTHAMADLARDKNPCVEVVTHEARLCAGNLDDFDEIIRQANVVIDTGDQREGKLLLNRRCVERKTTYIVAGAFRRAYGGQVIRVRPGESGCYQCFLSLLPREFRMGGGEPNPEPIAYSDRPVPIEPGLSLDIMPIAHLVAKLALQELLHDQETTLRSLDEDLAASMYLWLNRREQDTQYSTLDPLGFGVDGVRILRWYGMHLPRDPDCPVCGDSEKHVESLHGVDLTEDEIKAFEEMRARVENGNG